MTDQSSNLNRNFLSGQQNLPSEFIHKDKEPLMVSNDGFPSASSSHKSESVINNDTTKANTNVMSNDDAIVTTTRDTIVVLITLTIIFLTLIATYYLWRKHRNNFANSLYKSEEYRYSRLSQNDVEVDNISFQGDLTQKFLLNSVPVCVEDDGGDDQVRPATLCLEYDSLITISSDDNNGNQSWKNSMNRSSVKDDGSPVNLLIDELSDEQDLLQ
ncbi:unnamed protein product [Orchesella dallaii]|uniref:Uncharacterized protein n=1 Tax=Orchesella dallaii TaxID=48710 RepID=A0ABP1Q002_9HEXA